MPPRPEERPGGDAFTLRARPKASSLVRLLGPTVAGLLVGVALVVAGATGAQGTRGSRVPLLALGTVLVLGAAVALVQSWRLARPGVLVRLDGGGVHVRRGPGYRTLAWPRVARVQVDTVTARLGRRGRPHRTLLLHWVPRDDADVVAAPLHPLERAVPLAPPRSRTATWLNGRDRSADVRELLAWLRERRPGTAVLDTALGTGPTPPVPEGPGVLVVSAHGAMTTGVPEVLAALRATGRAPTVALAATGLTDPTAYGRAVGARAVRVDDADERPEAWCEALEGCGAVVVVGSEPGTAGRFGSPRPLLDAVGPRRVVVVVRDAVRAGVVADRAGPGVTVVVAERVTHEHPLGTVTLRRTPVPHPIGVAAADLGAVVAALVAAPAETTVGGVLHLDDGGHPVVDAVAGCAG